MKVKYTSIIFGVVFIISVYILLISLPKKTISSEDIHSVKVQSELLESGIQIESENKEADSFTTVIEYPRTQIDEIDSVFEQWINKEEKTFYDQLEQTPYFFIPKQIAHLTIKSEIEKMNKHILNFKLTSSQYIKDNNRTRNIKTFVIDIKNKKVINIQDVLNLNEENKQSLKEYIIQSNTTKSLTDQLIDNKLENLEHIDWIITKDELILYFYETNNENSRISIYTSRLKTKTIRNILTKEYKNLLFPEPKKPKPKKPKPKKVKSNRKLIALTFDDGPDPNITPQILKTLKKNNIKATFFILANNAKHYPNIAKDIVKNGHEIANHSKSHANLNAIKNSRFKTEIIQSQKEIEAITGVKTTLFRPPYGEYNQAVLDIAKKSEQEVILWSVDTYDWRTLDQKKILNEVKRQTNEHSIILAHDVDQSTADSLKGIINYLHQSGFEFVTVSELLPHIKPATNGVYYGR